MSRLLPRSISFTGRRLFSSSPIFSAEASHATVPGWKGRPTDDHVVNRKGEHDVQSDASQSGMEKHDKGEEGSQGLSGKDEGNFNKKAKEDHPEAPGPVLGMNDERGGKGH